MLAKDTIFVLSEKNTKEKSDFFTGPKDIIGPLPLQFLRCWGAYLFLGDSESDTFFVGSNSESDTFFRQKKCRKKKLRILSKIYELPISNTSTQNCTLNAAEGGPEKKKSSRWVMEYNFLHISVIRTDFSLGICNFAHRKFTNSQRKFVNTKSDKKSVGF